MLGGKAWFAGGAADVRPSLEDGILVLGDIGSRNGRSGRGSGRRGAFITPFEALCKLWNGLLGADEPVILQFACPLNELGAEGLSDVARIYVLACSRVHLDDVVVVGIVRALGGEWNVALLMGPWVVRRASVQVWDLRYACIGTAPGSKRGVAVDFGLCRGDCQEAAKQQRQRTGELDGLHFLAEQRLLVVERPRKSTMRKDARCGPVATKAIRSARMADSDGSWEQKERKELLQ